MKILVGISGGVDSTYTAKLLKLLGNEVEGAVLVMHAHTEIEAAKQAARDADIPLHIIDCTEDFDRIVKSNLVEEYCKGRTPNPCVICNEQVKMRRLYEYAMKNGFDKIATGHYASVEKSPLNGAPTLALADHSEKDQTYMLYRLPREILGKLVLPLHAGKKTMVREMARHFGFSAAEKKDSQEICFLPDGDHAAFIEERVGKCPQGDFVDEEGNYLGKHKGIIHYTVGQRKGLGIALGKRMFVTSILPEKNQVVLSEEKAGSNEISLSDVVFPGMDLPESTIELRLDLKVRYTAPFVAATVRITPDGNVTVFPDTPTLAAPGQSAVLYKDEFVILGGFIS